MRILMCSVLTCFVSVCFAQLVDYHDYGDGPGGLGGIEGIGGIGGIGAGGLGSQCPKGAKCMPADLCPAAAQWGSIGSLLRPNRCSPVLAGAHVCCWAPAALAPRSVADKPRGPRSTPADAPAPAHGSTPSAFAVTQRSLAMPTAANAITPSPRPAREDTTTGHASHSKAADKSATPALNATLRSIPKAGAEVTPKRSSPSAQACQKYIAMKHVRRVRNTPPLRQMYPVVGGVRAINAEFPYMVAIGYVVGQNNPNTTNLLWRCGGSLISDRYVLTAAHCITDAQRENMKPVALRAGVNFLSEGPRQMDDYSIASITLHPRHSASLKYFDFALLRTDRPVAFTPSLHPVCLPTASTRLDANTKLLVAGWGAVDPPGYEFSTNLKKAEMRLIQHDQCKTLVPMQKELPRGIDDTMICAADPSGKSDTCVGDSGGPLAVRSPQGDVLVGLTSFGPRPCNVSKPAVYANVFSQLSWIESIVWP